MSLKIVFILAYRADPDEMLTYAAFHLGMQCLPKYLFMVKAPNIAHLSLWTCIGYKKKETKLKKSIQPNKVIILYYLHRVQNEKCFPGL